MLYRLFGPDFRAVGFPLNVPVMFLKTQEPLIDCKSVALLGSHSVNLVLLLFVYLGKVAVKENLSRNVQGPLT